MRASISVLFVVATIVAGNTCADAGLLTTANESQIETWRGGADASFGLLYAKADGDDSSAFHAAVDGRGQTITLIEAKVADADPWQLIGGYNPQSWSSLDGFHIAPMKGRTAFIFNLSSPVMYAQKTGDVDDPGQYQTNNIDSIGPAFGGGDIVVNGDLSTGYAYNFSYGPNGAGVGNILGLDGQTQLLIGAIEVYQVSSVNRGVPKPIPNPKPGSKNPSAVPEPPSLVLLLTGGLIGVARFGRRQFLGSAA